MDLSNERLVRKGDYIYGSFLRPEVVDGFINAVNPGDRADVLGRFAFSESSVDDAVEHASLAARLWRRIGLNDRAAVVRRFRQALTRNADRIVRLITRETGRPFWEARQELAETLIAVEHFLDAGVALLAPTVTEEGQGRTDPTPRGVVGMVCSFSMPVYTLATATTAVVLSGNTVVFKPSKFTPGLGQLVAEMWDQCKLPRGVVNMVQGSGAAVGRKLVNHPNLAALMFVGNFETANEIRRYLLDRPEMPAFYQTGGKGIAMVLDGCELERAVYDVMVGAFLSAGQRHNSTGRVIVQAGVYEAFVDLLLRRTLGLRVGYGFDPEVFMGPLISENLRSRFRRFGKAQTKAGNQPILEGSAFTRVERRGFYVSPAIHRVDWREGNPAMDEEPPGPTLLIYKVESLDEAIALHNQALYRPVASVFPPPQWGELPEVSERLRTGAILVNQPTTSSTLPLAYTALGRSSSGTPWGVQLVDCLTYPRAVLNNEKPFNPAKALPGTNWLTGLSPLNADGDEDTIIDEDLSSMLEPEL